MSQVRRQPDSRAGAVPKPAGLRARLAEAEETLRAIRSGEVDALMVKGKRGDQVFTLEGAEHAYRVLIESMTEGALALTADKTIFYANQGFARMVRCPLEEVVGTSFRRFISSEDRVVLRPLLKRPGLSGSKMQALLHGCGGVYVPVQISVRRIGKRGSNSATIAMVVTDMTEARRTEDMLRALSHRLVRAQEAERGRVALVLHDHITQLLCGILVRCQALMNKLSAHEGPSKGEAEQLRRMLIETAGEVERISRNLRPSVLEHLGLAAVLRDTSKEFADRTGLSVKLVCGRLTDRLPAETELTLYRILEEALINVERHARARHVTVSLSQQRGFVRLIVKDDGDGFDPDRQRAKRMRRGGLGLLSMRERAACVGGGVKIRSVRGGGTEIEVRMVRPLPPAAGSTLGRER